jgi:lauroyl/myristoyl acyltransferase
MHVVRLRGARFELHIMPPLPPELLETGAGRDRLKQALESWGERAVKSHIDQWYMLHRLRFK